MASGCACALVPDARSCRLAAAEGVSSCQPEHVLPPGNRLRKPADFAVAIRRGHRATAGRLVIHLYSPTQQTDLSPRVGLVVPNTVGNAVERNRVKRRLRALMTERLSDLGDGELLVLRARPGITGLSSAELGRLVDQAVGNARRKRSRVAQ